MVWARRSQAQNEAKGSFANDEARWTGRVFGIKVRRERRGNGNSAITILCEGGGEEN